MARTTDLRELCLICDCMAMTLYDGIGGPVTAQVHIWHVLESGAGSGETLLWHSDLTNDEPRIYSNNISLTRWIQDEVIRPVLSYKNPELPVIPATFTRTATLPWYMTEHVTDGRDEMTFSWFDFAPPFFAEMGADQKGTSGQTKHDHRGALFPARSVRITMNGKEAKGISVPQERDGSEDASCRIAMNESWVRVG